MNELLNLFDVCNKDICKRAWLYGFACIKNLPCNYKVFSTKSVKLSVPCLVLNEHQRRKEYVQHMAENQLGEISVEKTTIYDLV